MMREGICARGGARCEKVEVRGGVRELERTRCSMRGAGVRVEGEELEERGRSSRRGEELEARGRG